MYAFGPRRPGSWWKPPVAQALSAAGHAEARVNPRHVRDFGPALGYRANTDAQTQAQRGLVGRRRRSYA